MLRKQMGGPFLIAPGKTTARVLRELHVVGWIGIDEVAGTQRQRRHIVARKRPAFQRATICGKVANVVNPCVAAEWHIEQTASIEPAEPVESRAIQVIEERSSLLGVFLVVREQCVETIAVLVKELLVVF